MKKKNWHAHKLKRLSLAAKLLCTSTSYSFVQVNYVCLILWTNYLRFRFQLHLHFLSEFSLSLLFNMNQLKPHQAKKGELNAFDIDIVLDWWGKEIGVRSIFYLLKKWNRFSWNKYELRLSRWCSRVRKRNICEALGAHKIMNSHEINKQDVNLVGCLVNNTAQQHCDKWQQRIMRWVCVRACVRMWLWFLLERWYDLKANMLMSFFLSLHHTRLSKYLPYVVVYNNIA